ncbi:hypothetical protein CGCSCA1_v001770 [Colletotrichum siamense]|nr:hypothetical protein CGCSCA1_v001770 [Colletotrichum siamense]
MSGTGLRLLPVQVHGRVPLLHDLDVRP